MPAPTAPVAITQTLPASAFKSPLIALSGVVDHEMYEKFRKQFDKASDQNLVVIELSTLGGDPEMARMIGEDMRFHPKWITRGASCSSARRRSIPPARP